MILALFTLALLILAGLPAALSIRQPRNVSLLVGLAFLFGSGIVACALFFLSLVATTWTALTVGLAIIILACIPIHFILRHRRNGALQTDHHGVRVSHAALRFYLLLDAITVVTVVAHARFATWVRLFEWDYLGNWGLKAKVFFQHRGIDWAFLHFHEYGFTMPDYPPLVPLLLSFFALVRGAWEDQWLGIVFTAFGAATILVIRGLALHETGSNTQAALAGLAVASPTLTLFVGLGDGVVTAFGTAAVLLIRGGNTLAGATLLGFAMLSKNEGTALLVATVVAMAASRPQMGWKRVLRLWPAVAILLPWMVVRRWLDLAPVYLQGNPWARLAQHLQEAPEILLALLRYPPGHVAFWILLLGIVVWRARWIWNHERFLAAVLLLQFGAFVAQNFFTPFTAVHHIEYSWHRLCFQLAPLLVVLALLSLRAVWVASRESASHESAIASPSPCLEQTRDSRPATKTSEA